MDELLSTVAPPCVGDECITASSKSKVSPELVLGLSLVAFVGAVIFTVGMLIFIKRQCREEDKRTEEVIREKQMFEEQNGGMTGYKSVKKQNFAFISKTNSEVILGRRAAAGDQPRQYVSRNVNIAAEGDAGDDEHVAVNNDHDNPLFTADAIMTASDFGIGQANGACNVDDETIQTDQNDKESDDIVNDIMSLVHTLESESARSVAEDSDEPPQVTVL